VQFAPLQMLIVRHSRHFIEGENYVNIKSRTHTQEWSLNSIKHYACVIDLRRAPSLLSDFLIRRAPHEEKGISPQRTHAWPG
jgi:hypothetical protein